MQSIKYIILFHLNGLSACVQNVSYLQTFILKSALSLSTVNVSKCTCTHGSVGRGAVHSHFLVSHPLCYIKTLSQYFRFVLYLNNCWLWPSSVPRRWSNFLPNQCQSQPLSQIHVNFLAGEWRKPWYQYSRSSCHKTMLAAFLEEGVSSSLNGCRAGWHRKTVKS
jgi:hypothetical protein